MTVAIAPPICPIHQRAMLPSTGAKAKPGDYYCSSKQEGTPRGYCVHRVQGWGVAPPAVPTAPALALSGAPAPANPPSDVAAEYRLRAMIAAVEAAATVFASNGTGATAADLSALVDRFYFKHIMPAVRDELPNF